MNTVSIEIDPEEVINNMDTDDIIEIAGKDRLLDEIGADDAIEFWGTREIIANMDVADVLDEIGEDAAMEHFGLFKKGGGVYK